MIPKYLNCQKCQIAILVVGELVQAVRLCVLNKVPLNVLCYRCTEQEELLLCDHRI